MTSSALSLIIRKSNIQTLYTLKPDFSWAAEKANNYNLDTDKKYLSIVERNIVNEDSLTYKFKFLKKDVKTTKELKELIERADRDKKLILNGVTLY